MLHYQNYTQIAVYNVICGFVTHPSEKINFEPPIAFPIELHCSNLKYLQIKLKLSRNMLFYILFYTLFFNDK